MNLEELANEITRLKETAKQYDGLGSYQAGIIDGLEMAYVLLINKQGETNYNKLVTTPK